MGEGRTSKSAVQEAIMLKGDGWLLPIAAWLAGGAGAGYFCYSIVGIPGIIYAETVYGAVTAVRLLIKPQGQGVDGATTEIAVPIDHEYDGDERS